MEPAAADLRGVDGNPLLAFAWGQRIDRALAQRGCKRIESSRHLLSHTLQNDAPADSGIRIPAVDLEGDSMHDSLAQLCLSGGAEDHDCAVDCVIDRKDLGLVADQESNPADIAPC